MDKKQHISNRRNFVKSVGVGVLGVSMAGCLSMEDDRDSNGGMEDNPVVDPSMADRVEVDRFSEEAGTLMVRSEENNLPEPNEPIDFDQPPFITKGLGPNGELIEYYNFDVQLTMPSPIYVLFRQEENSPIEGQLNIIDTIPGDEGYNDFWNVHKVTVPNDYRANQVTSLQEINSLGFDVEPTNQVVNCPVVPEGSTATKRLGGGSTGLVHGWYKDQIVSYFEFTEASLTLSNGSIPLSPIYVSFNLNPNMEGGGPQSGFMTESDSSQTHNVVATLPESSSYSPLWLVNVYDNTHFENVSDLESARNANILATGVARVNCPIVSIQTQ